MKPEERQALQQNELEQEYVGHLKPFLEKYGRLVALAAVAVVLLFVAISVFRGASRGTLEAGWGGLFDAGDNVAAVEAVADEELGEGLTNATVWAHLRAGNLFLGSASRSAFSDKAAAEDGFESARKHFEAALAIDDAPSAARAQALYGLASVEEAVSDGDVSAATKTYTRLVEDYPDSPLVPAAELRLEALERPTTGPFLAWLAKQEPKQEDIARPLDNVPTGEGDDDAPIPGVDADADAGSELEAPPAGMTPDVPAAGDETASAENAAEDDGEPKPAEPVASESSEDEAEAPAEDDAPADGGE
ncbi:hypothetical protein [Alienimonas chondri]|uniref:Tetratricopeptide repeat protein n=1 Tax=Alienimonas chondri TaxID=2681879 RepID=A0ABX1VB25_9PLAN|nr:hypothetical protein [Alienimonas chondri]NNJ24241.1 hypothetical protein [Alienimonas chondri]